MHQPRWFQNFLVSRSRRLKGESQDRTGQKALNIKEKRSKNMDIYMYYIYYSYRSRYNLTFFFPAQATYYLYLKAFIVSLKGIKNRGILAIKNHLILPPILLYFGVVFKVFLYM